MYAIVFNFDYSLLETFFSSDTTTDEEFSTSYERVIEVFEAYGFIRQHGHFFLGKDKQANSVMAVLATQEISKDQAWFGQCLKSIRLLRIEESMDLSVAI